MSNFIISAVPADGLALLDARTSVGTVMTKFKSFIYTGLTMAWLTSLQEMLLQREDEPTGYKGCQPIYHDLYQASLFNSLGPSDSYMRQ